MTYYPPDSPPPYTYDDPRFIYDELCMYYDGFFDKVCLLGPEEAKRKVGASGAGRMLQKKPFIMPEPSPMLELQIKTCLKKVNDEEYDTEKCDIFRWKGELDKDLTVTSRRVTHGRTNRSVYGNVTEVGNPADSREATGTLVSVTKPERTVTTSKIEERVTSSKITVSSSLDRSSGPRISVKIGKKDTTPTYLVKVKKKE